MTPSPALLDRLSRTRFLPRWAAATIGVGERRSASKGAGMEFADHRAYQPGDDLRHLDPHIYARLGESFIREYEVYRQLPITVIVDASRSMSLGDGERYRFARDLASLIGFVGMAGGDQVRFAVGWSGKIDWSPRYHGLPRAQAAFDWLNRERAIGGSFVGCLPTAARELSNRGLTIIISDWWDFPSRELGAIAAAGQEIWAIHLLSREEADPSLLGDGDVRMVDAETGQEVDLHLDRKVLDRFRASLDAWRQELQSECEGVRGRYLRLATDTKLDTLFLQDWRRQGLLM